MVSGKIREELTDEAILKRIDEYSIYRYYIGEEFDVGKVMHSPMPGRKDTHPSFIVGSKAGFLYHVDFSDSRLRGNCFQFVMQKEMLPNYNNALEKIDKDFNLGIRATPKEEYKAPVFIQPTLTETEITLFQVQYSSRFSLEERKYWEQYYISPPELEENQIYAVRKLWINRRLQPLKKDEICFGYREGYFWKIYRPTACKRRKWLNNIPSGTVEGIKGIRKADKGIVTKSRKDRIVLCKFMRDVLSVQNESISALPLQMVEVIKENWDDAYINYDNDLPGKQNSYIVTGEYGFKHLNVPDSYLTEGIKDFADMIRVYGPDKVHDYLQSKNLIK